MYNVRPPDPDELPSTGRLIRSTVLALFAAIAILVTVVLPAEYGIDPTRIGRVLGLTEMGEIKMALAAEAEADRIAQEEAERRYELETGQPFDSVLNEPEAAAADPESVAPAAPAAEPAVAQTAANANEAPSPAADPARDRLAEALETLAAAEAERAPAAAANPPVAPPTAQPDWTDTVSFTLTPGEGIEFKLVMDADAIAEYNWSAEEGVVNYDLHGDGSGQSISYEKGRGVPGDEGELRAAFTGNHGWFWRNRTDRDVTVTLRVRGAYKELKRTA